MCLFLDGAPFQKWAWKGPAWPRARVTTRKHLIITGRVQGVAFRHYTLETATHLGIAGWIRNLRDGRRIEMIVEGNDENLETFLTWCHEGPSFARIESVEVDDETGDEAFTEFQIRRTA